MVGSEGGAGADGRLTGSRLYARDSGLLRRAVFPLFPVGPLQQGVSLPDGRRVNLWSHIHRWSIAMNRFMLLCSLVAVSGSVAFHASAASVLKSQTPCAYDDQGRCLYFAADALPPKTLRAINLSASGPGQALVMAHGSGVCQNTNPNSAVADFDTQLVNDPQQDALHQGAGGNEYKFLLVAGENGVFNLAAERLFTLKAAGTQHFALNLSLERLDGGIACEIRSVALTVLFLPG